eukprot:4097589-Amphidinium_carterae.4
MAAVQHSRAKHSTAAAGELHASMNAAQRHLLERQSSADESKRRRRNVLRLTDTVSRACNREHLLLLDAELACVGLSLKKLLASPRFSATPEGVERHDLYTGAETRYEQRRPDGSVVATFELSERTFRSQWTWHLVQDQGPKGMSALSLLWHEGCRGSYEVDPAHRIHNDWGCAVSAAGLGAIRTMLRQVISLRSGPFKSRAHHALLQQSIEQLQSSQGHTQPLWTYFYPDVFEEMHGSTDDPAYGTPENIEATFREALYRLSAMGPTSARLTRWFSLEQRAEDLMSTGLHAHQYLLTYTMLAKGQWKKWSDTPMGQAGQAVAVVDNHGADNVASKAVGEGAECVDDDAEPERAEGSSIQPLQVKGNVNKSISVAVAVLCQSLVTRIGRGLVTLSKPLRAAFSEVLVLLKTPRGLQLHESHQSKHPHVQTQALCHTVVCSETNCHIQHPGGMKFEAV